MPIIAFIIGFIIAAVSLGSAAREKDEKIKELENRISAVQNSVGAKNSELSSAKAEIEQQSGQIDQLSDKVKQLNAEKLLMADAHKAELEATTQKVRYEERLAGIEEGKMIAEDIIERMVEDRKTKDAMIESLNSTIAKLTNDLSEKLAAVGSMLDTNSYRDIIAFTALATVLLIGILMLFLIRAHQKQAGVYGGVAQLVQDGTIILRRGITLEHIIAALQQHTTRRIEPHDGGSWLEPEESE